MLQYTTAGSLVNCCSRKQGLGVPRKQTQGRSKQHFTPELQRPSARFYIPHQVSCRSSNDEGQSGPDGLESLLTGEQKVREVAEALDTNRDVAQRIIEMRPGILLVPDVAGFFKARVYSLSLKHEISQREASRMILANPALAFDQS